MHKYTPKKFNIPELKGISQKTIDEHLKLYEGYVNSVNTIHEKISSLMENPEENTYTIGELRRRLGFEFDGMRNHEYYFEALADGPSELSTGDLKASIEKNFESFDKWLAEFKMLAKTRGVGWAILYYDKESDRLLNVWVDEQHLGHLTGLSPILALDMWEHSFVADYYPSGKGDYIEDFFENLNWKKVEENFDKAK